MEPSFWSWEKSWWRSGTVPTPDEIAMEPSFWSWEKSVAFCALGDIGLLLQWSPAFGAGKRDRSWSRSETAAPCNGAQLLELGKESGPSADVLELAGNCNGAQLLELGKESSRFFHQLTTSVAHLCEQRKFWGRRVGLLLPDRLGKLALTRARALPRGTEGAGALARRSAGLGWVAPRGLQRI